MRVAVAASGGMDSTALLHCVARWGASCGVQVHALHVHHGLHADADAWMRQVAAQCRRWGRSGSAVTFHAHRVDARPAPGDSVEAWARRQRYAGLALLARAAGCSLILLAHHRRDQAETVLLQALRGAGPAGLSAMPRSVERAGLTWMRPWLHQPREAIAAYAQRWRLSHVDDPSNSDPRLARSRLRQRLWPSLIDTFADAETALVAVAARAQEARSIVDEVARADALTVCDGQGLRRAAWLALSRARQANVLRHWLGQCLTTGVPESLVQRLLQELPASRAGRWPAGALQLRLHAGYLQLASSPLGSTSLPASAGAARRINLGQPGVHAAWPWRGAIEVAAVGSGGVPAAWLAEAELRPRQGGERFQARPGGVPRSLKKQFQEAKVPAWMRDVPLLFAAGSLVFVPGLGIDARALQAAGEPRLALTWRAASG